MRRRTRRGQGTLLHQGRRQTNQPSNSWLYQRSGIVLEGRQAQAGGKEKDEINSELSQDGRKRQGKGRKRRSKEGRKQERKTEKGIGVPDTTRLAHLRPADVAGRMGPADRARDRQAGRRLYLPTAGPRSSLPFQCRKSSVYCCGIECRAYFWYRIRSLVVSDTL